MKRDPKLTSMNVSIPKSQRAYVEQRVRGGGYSSVSDYVRDLIRNDSKARAQERLEKLLIEGLESGDPIEVTPQFWADMRKRLRGRYERAARRKGTPKR